MPQPFVLAPGGTGGVGDLFAVSAIPSLAGYTVQHGAAGHMAVWQMITTATIACRGQACDLIGQVPLFLVIETFILLTHKAPCWSHGALCVRGALNLLAFCVAVCLALSFRWFKRGRDGDLRRRDPWPVLSRGF